MSVNAYLRGRICVLHVHVCMYGSVLVCLFVCVCSCVF